MSYPDDSPTTTRALTCLILYFFLFLLLPHVPQFIIFYYLNYLMCNPYIPTVSLKVEQQLSLLNAIIFLMSVNKQNLEALMG